jgi:hypothetical protein
MALCGYEETLIRGKLRSEGGIMVTHRFGVSLSGRAFMASQEVLSEEIW